MPVNAEYNASELGDLLPPYYQYLFPTSLFYKWLSYGNVTKNYFQWREFSFTLAGDIYVRYNSFNDEKELRQALIDKVPEKIDIGAVFSSLPKEAKKGLAQARERELVFDIDMTDYDEVRTCCQGADLCGKCWPYLAIAAKILDRALREDFGFKHLLWVYSGRRGIHCWIADDRARRMAVDVRSALGSYLTVIEGGQFKSKKVSLPSGNLHPSLNKALRIIDEHFEKLIIDDQKQLDTKERVESIIKLCSNKEFAKILHDRIVRDWKRWEKVDKKKLWTEICSLSQGFFKNVKAGVHFIDEVKLQFCYPRLDIAVTKGLNHLLKAPFCVHPKTGRVCVPMDMNTIDFFEPAAVPTVKQLIKEMHDQEELAKYGGGGEQGSAMKNVVTRTSLRDGVKIFESFVEELSKEHRPARQIKQDIDNAMELLAGY